MSYVESFETEMSRARIRMADYNSPYLDHLQAAHDAEMKQLSKEEFYRGYESGVAARDAEQWQLDRERAKIIEAVRKVVPEGYFGSDEMLSEICRAIYSPVFGWTAEAGRYLCDRLIYLLGGKSTNKSAETSAKVVKNGEKYQLATYDVLGNERHKAVCELRKLRLDTGSAVKKLAIALGVKWNSDNAERSVTLLQKRLIHLLGGDQPTLASDVTIDIGDGSEPIVICEGTPIKPLSTLSDLWGIWKDERNFSTIESYMDAEDAEPNPAETSGDESDHVSLDTPSSITDELREWVRDLMPDNGILYTIGGATLDELYEIADRIDEQFSRICEQQESVLQQTISDMSELRRECDRLTEALDELQADPLGDVLVRVENERDELRQKLSARDAIINNYHERMKGLDEAERRMAVAESKCKELQSKYDNLLVTCKDLTSLANKYFNEVNELFSDETN